MAKQPVNPTVDGSDAVLEQQRKSAQGRRRKEDENVIRNLMSTRPGRSWLYRLMADCCMFEEPFVAGSPDATGYNLGSARIGRRLLDEVMRADSRKYLEMIQEQRESELAEQGNVQDRARQAQGADVTADDQWPPLTPPAAPPAMTNTQPPNKS